MGGPVASVFRAISSSRVSLVASAGVPSQSQTTVFVFNNQAAAPEFFEKASMAEEKARRAEESRFLGFTFGDEF